MAFPFTRLHRKKAIICNFGTGGHAEQMRRLLSCIDIGELVIIAQSPLKPNDARYGEYSKIAKVRPEYASLLGILAIPFLVIASMVQTMRLFIRFDIRLLISTGPGVAIIPAIIARLFGAKVLFFESWCRFSAPSLSGQIMSRIADDIFVQNEEVRKFYKKACYMGRL